MMAVLATGMIGMVLAMRWPVAVWFVAGLAVIAFAIISSSSGADALFQSASWLIAYNLGLAMALRRSNVCTAGACSRCACAQGAADP